MKRLLKTIIKILIFISLAACIYIGGKFLIDAFLAMSVSYLTYSVVFLLLAFVLKKVLEILF